MKIQETVRELEDLLEESGLLDLDQWAELAYEEGDVLEPIDRLRSLINCVDISVVCKFEMAHRVVSAVDSIEFISASSKDADDLHQREETSYSMSDLRQCAKYVNEVREALDVLRGYIEISVPQELQRYIDDGSYSQVFVQNDWRSK